MQLENSFQVSAPPDRVFAYLLDINKVVGCVPGAELSEVVDPSTFKGKVKVKVGPITVAYSGTARISERSESDHTATLTAEGRETTGPGSARATAQMSVVAADGGSTVRIVTEYHIAGRVAQFGRGVMEDVSRRLVNEMAACIKANVETSNPPPQPDASGSAQGAGVQTAGAKPASSSPSPAPAAAVATARPVNALSLMFAIVWDRIRGLFGGRSA
jgi:carbon monoxide dehydrogenase subunit G